MAERNQTLNWKFMSRKSFKDRNGIFDKSNLNSRYTKNTQSVFENLINKINDFNYIIYAGSLGRYFRNDLNSFSQNPYIKNIENYKDLELDNILNNNQGLKIGISWKSLKNRYSSEKSLSLEDFENIFKIKDIRNFKISI